MSDVLRVSLLGAMPGGEVWSVNPVFQLIASTDPVTQAELTTVATAINALVIPTGVRNMIPAGITHTGVRLEARQYTGDLEAQLEQMRAAPVVGTGSGAHPFQTSLVTSLRTATPGGKGRGRLYWPANAVALSGSTLRVASADVTSFLSGIKTYLTAIQGCITPTLGTNHLAVWSRAYPGSHQVTSIQMGDICDTQRRRRDSAVETYTATTWP